MSEKDLLLTIIQNQQIIMDQNASEFHFLKTKTEQIMATLADIQAQNTALIAAVTAEDTVIDSAVVLITGFGTTLAGLQKQLSDALASNDPTATQAVVYVMGTTITDINAKKDALAAAVAAGTPAAPAV